MRGGCDRAASGVAAARDGADDERDTGMEGEAQKQAQARLLPRQLGRDGDGDGGGGNAQSDHSCARREREREQE